MFLISKRAIDIIVCLILLPFVIFILLIIFIIIKSTSNIPFIYWSKRVGLLNKTFDMPKIRTMSINTPQKATHLLIKPEKYLTRYGTFFRKTSLDELPQLFLILNGQMTLVGPRPALFNQYDLIKLRTKKNIHTLKPGLTGWAQINGRDNISISEKVDLDLFYLRNKSLLLDIKIIFFSFFLIFKDKTISH